MKKYNSVFKESDVNVSSVDDAFADLNNFLNDIVEVTRKLEVNNDFKTFRKKNRQFSLSYHEFSKMLLALSDKFSEVDDLAEEGGLFNDPNLNL